MSYTIDTTTYNKATHLPEGVGWSVRPHGMQPTTIVIHTTSAAQQQTTFAHEAEYLWNSRIVSAHYLNGKQSQIAQILNPDLEAWHAGGKQPNGSWTAQPAYDNSHSIGIENHVSLGEQWTSAQHDSLTWLVQTLMARYHIANEQIETHRAIALPGPNIRKHDPSGWDDGSFYAWRAALIPLLPSPFPYRVVGLPVYQAANHQGALWGHLKTGQTVEIDNPTNGHVAAVDGEAAAIGFVDMQGLEKV